MTGYFGTDEHQRLQRKSDGLMEWIMQTPGACVTGRHMASDDFEALGWQTIRQHLAEDGAFGFRWVTPDKQSVMREALADTGASIFDWNGFIGEADDLIRSCAPLLELDLPDGFQILRAQGETLAQMQEFLAGYGITPLSTALMGGELCPALSNVITDGTGRIVAAGFSGMLQNRFSQLADCAWMGLIAVDPECRGLGLGARITASVIMDSLSEMGAKRVVGFAAPDNTASIAMLNRVGLTPCPEKSCVAAMSETRPTR